MASVIFGAGANANLFLIGYERNELKFYKENSLLDAELSGFIDDFKTGFKGPYPILGSRNDLITLYHEKNIRYLVTSLMSDKRTLKPNTFSRLEIIDLMSEQGFEFPSVYSSDLENNKFKSEI